MRLYIALASFGAIAALLMTLAAGAIMFFYQATTAAYVPLAEEISLRGTGITTVYDRSGQHIGVLTNPNSAITSPIALSEISPYLIEATISTEDDNYWTHKGFDLKGLSRAFWQNYVGEEESTTGGSTITQQLVKTAYFLTECEEIDGVRSCVAPRTLDRKMKELVLAVETESLYSKEQILTWYMNSISYSGRYVGAEAAAQGYFQKPAKDLTLPEAALLAGIPAAPTLYSPRLNCVTDDAGECVYDEMGRTQLGGEAQKRQQYVLDLMAERGRITPEEAAAAKAEPVYLFDGTNSQLAGAFVDDQVEPRLVRMCQAGILPMVDGAQDCVESVHSAGYKVTSTLDWTQTQNASAMLNKSLVAGLQAGCDCHQGSIVTIEPASGQVVVYVPGIDPTWVSDPRVAGSIDQATEIQQPGSSFKPAVYLAWFDGLAKTPMSSLWDTNPLKVVDRPDFPNDQVTIFNPGRIPNVSNGLITARAALGGSQNVPAFRAATEAGVPNVINMAKALGITTLEQNFDPTFRQHSSVYYGPAIATGGANVRVIDMAYMNATIANMGVIVGVPTYASTFEVKDALSVQGAEGEALDKALRQRDAFQKGHLRLPGTREVDPVTVLKVEAADGTILYEHGKDLVKKPVVNAGSVWMLHSIMSDCTARFLIWQCGTNNDDLSLDFFVNGTLIPGGIKTGTQQGADAKSTLATWMNGYSRYAATAVWIGNANKQIVRDGPEANYASANTTVRLFKNWMGAYHSHLQDLGIFETPAGFDEVKPENVKLAPYYTANTERGRGGGCLSAMPGWQRTDIDYGGGDCVKFCVPLPELAKDLALTLARQRGIPACGSGIYGGPRQPAPQPAQPTPAPQQAPQAAPTPQMPVPSGSAPIKPNSQPPPQQQPPQQQPPGQGGSPPGQGGGNGR